MKNNISFLSLVTSQSLFQFGESLYVMAVVTFIYIKTQSVLCATLFPFIRGLSSLISGVLAPLVMQKMPLRLLLIMAQGLQSLILLTLLFYLDRFELSLPVVSIFFAIIAFLQGWSSPSRNAMIQRIVKEEDLLRANSVQSTADQLASLAGFMLGGIIVVAIGTHNSLWISVILSIFSTIFACCIKDPTRAPVPPKTRTSLKDIKKTWSFVYEHPLYRRLFMLDSLEMIAASVWVGAFTLVFVEKFLHKNESWWGFLNGAYLLGTALGGFIALRASNWLKNRLKSAFIYGSLNLGIFTIVFSLCPYPILCLIIFLLMGIPNEIRYVALKTLMQKNADKSKVPQIFAAHHAVVNISVAVGIIIMGFITDYCGVQVAYLFSALLVLVSAGLATTLPSKQHRLGSAKAPEKMVS